LLIILAFAALWRYTSVRVSLEYSRRTRGRNSIYQEHAYGEGSSGPCI
jgi:hypothetical protein